MEKISKTYLAEKLYDEIKEFIPEENIKKVANIFYNGIVFIIDEMTNWNKNSNLNIVLQNH